MTTDMRVELEKIAKGFWNHLLCKDRKLEQLYNDDLLQALHTAAEEGARERTDRIKQMIEHLGLFMSSGDEIRAQILAAINELSPTPENPHG